MATEDISVDEVMSPTAVKEPARVEGAIIDTPADSRSRLYLLSALTENATDALVELTKLVTDIGSVVEKSEDMGSRKLYFPIRRRTELQLVSVFFHATGKMLDELRAELSHSELVARYLITDWRAGLNETGNKRVKKEVGTDV